MYERKNYLKVRLEKMINLKYGKPLFFCVRAISFSISDIFSNIPILYLGHVKEIYIYKQHVHSYVLIYICLMIFIMNYEIKRNTFELFVFDYAPSSGSILLSNIFLVKVNLAL